MRRDISYVCKFLVVFNNYLIFFFVMRKSVFPEKEKLLSIKRGFFRGISHITIMRLIVVLVYATKMKSKLLFNTNIANTIAICCSYIREHIVTIDWLCSISYGNQIIVLLTHAKRVLFDALHWCGVKDKMTHSIRITFGN